MYLCILKSEDKTKYIVGVFFNLKLIDVNKHVLIHWQKLIELLHIIFTLYNIIAIIYF